MTTNNGKHNRKNGNSKSAIASISSQSDDLQSLPTMDELLTPTQTVAENEIPPDDEALLQTLPPEEQPSTNAEDLLRQAKSQSQPPIETETPAEGNPQRAEPGGNLATASGEINNAILQAGQNLVESSEQADQELFTAGLEDAIAGGDMMTQGYQAGLLIRYGQGKLKSAQSLREQMGLLRSHTDASNTDVVQNALNQLGLNTDLQGEKKNPLGGITQAVSKSKHNGTDGIQLFRKPGTPQS